MTRGELFASMCKRLDAASERPRLDAMRIFEHVLHLDAAALIAHDEAVVDDAAAVAVEALVARRELGEPLAYCLGEVWFFGRRFEVDARVLVPRPETEVLIETVLAHLRGRETTPRPNVLDVGTGSGIIAVTLALELAQAQVTAVDVSADALCVARRNAEVHGVMDRMRLLESDLLARVGTGAQFDVIAANLPYVATGDIPGRPEALGFEPVLALDGGADGLDPYRRLVASLPGVLAEDGLVIFEAGPDTVTELRRFVGAALPRHNVAIAADYSGRPRFVAAATTANKQRLPA